MEMHGMNNIKAVKDCLNKIYIVETQVLLGVMLCRVTRSQRFE
jgi:hypothetical protein